LATAAADKKRIAAEADVAAAQAREKQAKVDFDTAFNAQTKKDSEMLSQLEDQVKKQQEQLDALGNRPLKDLEDFKGQVATKNKELADAAKKMKETNERLKQLEAEIARARPVEDIDITKIAPENLAKITSINSTGDLPYINLGSADNLRRQVTFSIYGKGIDGRPLKEPKGKLEVVRVTGEHTAQAKITELRDERRDPVLTGDFIYNPAWNSNLKQHVAIIGTIDLTGDGRDNITEFMRTLKNQNVEVDGYFDMKTRKLKKPDGDAPGEITRQTDLLIVGAGPDFGTGVVRANDAKAEEKNATLKAMQEVQDRAEKLGVRVIRLHNYLEMSGYALPKPLSAEKGKIGFQRNLESAGSPIERREPQQK
jgi:hypothetical protein